MSLERLGPIVFLRADRRMNIMQQQSLRKIYVLTRSQCGMIVPLL